MTAKEFAKKFAGQKIKWTKERTEFIKKDLGKFWDDSWPIGIVIGYNTIGQVIYEPSSEMKNHLGKHGKFKLYTTTTKHSFVPSYGTNVEFIELWHSPIKLEWPGICPACKSPAYVGAAMVDCSNSSCKHKYKTRSGLDLFLPIKK